jgi:lipid-A-disaccharide synthase-like uncharacterized protein
LILLSALLAGWLAGWGVARWRRQPWRIPPIRYAWLAILAFVPQLFAIYLPAIRYSLPVEWAAASIIGSQVLLLFFCWLNRKIPGILILATGLAANLLVMVANGGFMPISPETASRLVSSETLAVLEPGSRFGWKDILLLPDDTHLAVLSDQFLPPDWFPYQVAFSAGDVLIALGTFWMMVEGPRAVDHQRESGC